jgi:hypothetical protein
LLLSDLLLGAFDAKRPAGAPTTPPRSLGLSKGRLVGLGDRRPPGGVGDLRKGLGVVASGTRLMHDNLTLPRLRRVLDHGRGGGVGRVRHRFVRLRLARHSRTFIKYQRELKPMQKVD